jgi:FMN phosphatase YigB (HAD superfamily)
LQTAVVCAGRPLTVQEEAELLDAALIATNLGELYPGVAETLQMLVEAGVPLALVTKGYRPLQQAKIDAHGLGRFFDGHIAIVDHKDGGLLRELASRFGFRSPLVIGDSAASDVAPAQAAGFPVVQIDRGVKAEVWKHERWDGGTAPKVGSFCAAILWLLDRAPAADEVA